MSYILQQVSGDHEVLLSKALEARISGEQPDVYFVSREGFRVFGLRATLGVRSPLLRQLLHSVEAGDNIRGFSLDYEATMILKCLQLLTQGEIKAPSQEELYEVLKLSRDLGIDVQNCSVLDVNDNVHTSTPGDLYKFQEPSAVSLTTNEVDQKTPSSPLTFKLECAPDDLLPSMDQNQTSVDVNQQRINCLAENQEIYYSSANGLKLEENDLVVQSIRSLEDKYSQSLNKFRGQYDCPVCGKSYSTKSTLKTHLVIHSTQKPFKCEDCGKEFNYKCNLMLHTKKYHSTITDNL